MAKGDLATTIWKHESCLAIKKPYASVSWDHTVHVWQASTGKQLLIYRGHASGVECITWSPDGKYLASGGIDNTVQIWNATTGKCY